MCLHIRAGIKLILVSKRDHAPSGAVRLAARTLAKLRGVNNHAVKPTPNYQHIHILTLYLSPLLFKIFLPNSSRPFAAVDSRNHQGKAEDEEHARCAEIHYSEVIMGAMGSQITSLSTVCSSVCSGSDQRKHQSSASLASV